MKTYVIENSQYPGLLLGRRARKESGKYAWRGWLIARWTNDLSEAKVWKTLDGAVKFAAEHSVVGIRVMVVENGQVRELTAEDFDS